MKEHDKHDDSHLDNHEPFEQFGRIGRIDKRDFAVDEFRPDLLNNIDGITVRSMSQNVNGRNNIQGTSKPRQWFNKFGIVFGLFATTVKNNLEQTQLISNKPQIPHSEIIRVVPNYKSFDTSFFIIPGRIPVPYVVFDTTKVPQN